MRSDLLVTTMIVLLLTPVLGIANEAPGPSNEPGIASISELPRKARFALFKAQQHQDVGDYEEAAVVLEEFLENNPDSDNYLVRFSLANNLRKLERLDDALKNYQATVDLEDRYTQGWLNLGELAYNLEEYDIAAEAILRGYELHPDKPVRLYYYGAVAYLLAEKPEKAAPFLENLVSGSFGEPKFEWFRALIPVALALKDAELGDRTVTGMLERFKSDPEAWHLAFQYAASLSDYRRAAISLTITGYLRDLSREELLQLADLYSVLRVPSRASDFYEAALVDGGSSREYERLASSYIASYDTKSALVTIEAAIAQEPTSRLWALKGDLHYMDKDYEASYAAFEECIKFGDGTGRPYLMMGYCAIEMDLFDEAIVRLEKAATFPEQEETAQQLVKRARMMNGLASNSGTTPDAGESNKDG